MATKTFIDLPAKDLEWSNGFFNGLGYSFTAVWLIFATGLIGGIYPLNVAYASLKNRFYEQSLYCKRNNNQ